MKWFSVYLHISFSVGLYCKGQRRTSHFSVFFVTVKMKSGNRPFSYSKKECGSNDISSHFVEFSNVYNTDRKSNATQSNLVYKDV